MTTRPALALLVLAPVLGEGLSSATPPLTLLLPWNLALFLALYGCGALLVREVVVRRRLGLRGLLLLGAAYAVYEEALVDRFWFTPSSWRDTGVGDYSEVWHTNLLLAAHLTAFHVAVSIGASVLLVHRAFPASRDEPWVGRRGLAVAAGVLLVVPPALYGRYDLDPPAQLAVAAGLVVVLIVAALWPRARPAPPVRPARPGRPARPRRVRAPGWVAFACTGAQFVLTYAVPTTGLPWPLGLSLALVPLAVGVALLGRGVRDRREDALAVVTGVLAFFAVLCVGVGLAGVYDTGGLGVLTLVALGWQRRRDRAAPATPSP